VHVAERVPAEALPTATRDSPRRHDDRFHHEPPRPEQTALAGITTAGVALPPDVRADMQARLGGDFSAVRVHTGDAASRAADELAAEAYTVGDDIVFARGVYAPHDPLGRLRLAHELAHVLQQRRGGPGGGLSHPADPFEVAAESTARAALAGPRPADAPERPVVARVVPGRTVVQRRAILDLPPARECASEVAAQSPWLGMSAAGMIDFRTATPTVTPSPDGPQDAAPTTRDAAPTTGPDELDPLARPQPARHPRRRRPRHRNRETKRPVPPRRPPPVRSPPPPRRSPTSRPRTPRLRPASTTLTPRVRPKPGR
jgi:hypothetical protein